MIKARFILQLQLIVTLIFSASVCGAAEVVIVGDAQLKPVVDVVSGMRKTLKASTRIVSPAEAAGSLARIVEKEKAGVVVALGKEALAEAIQLPPSIPVIYDLVLAPPPVTRANTTGFYIATPVSEYVGLVRNHLRSIRNITVIGTRDQLNLLGRGDYQRVSQQSVRSTIDFVNNLKELDSADAILLLPDTSILTATAMEEALLVSFKRRIPILGISERHVKQGALAALVVDTVHSGKLLGEYASKALKGSNIGGIPPAPPKKFELYLNIDTARSMGIQIPDSLIRTAKRVYP